MPNEHSSEICLYTGIKWMSHFPVRSWNASMDTDHFWFEEVFWNEYRLMWPWPSLSQYIYTHRSTSPASVIGVGFPACPRQCVCLHEFKNHCSWSAIFGHWCCTQPFCAIVIDVIATHTSCCSVFNCFVVSADCIAPLVRLHELSVTFPSGISMHWTKAERWRHLCGVYLVILDCSVIVIVYGFPILVSA